MQDEKAFIELLGEMVSRAPVPSWAAWIIVVVIAFTAASLSYFLAKQIATALGNGVSRVTSAIQAWLNAKKRLESEVRDLKDRISRAQHAVTGNGMWLTSPIKQPNGYDRLGNGSIPILTLANLKGGVGKSTLAGNLAAAYAEKSEKPVLLIDLDFQGSLTAMCATEGSAYAPARGHASRAAEAISGTFTAADLINATQEVRSAKNLRILPSFFDMAQAENRMLVNWLLNSDYTDIRYILANLLLEKDIQNHFSRVILDAPPRLTTAGIQALCASTDILIPTVLDTTSIAAVGTMLQQLKAHDSLLPGLQRVSIIGTLTRQDLAKEADELLSAEENYLSKTAKETRLDQRVKVTLLDRSVFVPHKMDIARAPGQGLAYSALGTNKKGSEIKMIFDRIVKKIG